MVGSHYRRGWGPVTAVIGNGLWQKSIYWAWFCWSDVNPSVGGRFQTPHWTPVAMVGSHHRRGWGPCTAIIGNVLWQKSMYWAWFYLSDVNSSIEGSISSTTLGPSDHGMKSPSSRLGTLYSYYRQWLMTKIHVFSLVLLFLVRRQFKRWGSISNTTLGPSGHGRKPPSSKLGTWYSYYREWFMTKIHVCCLVLLVRRQFKRWGSISNTTLVPNGMVGSHHRRGWGPCTAAIGNVLLQISMCWG